MGIEPQSFQYIFLYCACMFNNPSTRGRKKDSCDFWISELRFSMVRADAVENLKLFQSGTSFASIPRQSCTQGLQGVKRGTLLKVRHDGTAPLIHSFSSHVSSQGTGCATAATASAGTAGQGTPAKSGWEPSTEAERDTGVWRDERNWLPGATRNHTERPRREKIIMKKKTRCNSVYH